jgi:prepilin-type N-terminal cleavage/methylation domain-containing protein
LKPEHQGYTIVELATVLIILGILAATAGSRFLDMGLFGQSVSSDVILSTLRNTQQLSFGRDSVVLRIASDTSTYSLSSLVGGVEQVKRTFNHSDVTLSVGAIATIGSNPCSALAANTSVDIPFNSNAEISHAKGYQICLNTIASVCISPAGFAHVGACE